MNWQMIVTIAVAVLNGLLVPFVVWLVKENTAHKVALAQMQNEFVTWKHLEQWRTETAADFTKVRELIQTVALSVARLEGATTGHKD